VHSANVYDQRIINNSALPLRPQLHQAIEQVFDGLLQRGQSLRGG
jgi:hypothetical protein